MEELRDRNGLTESEFLAQYDASKYERPSVTVDIIITNDNNVLLIRRGGHPNLGKLAFPGGFVEMNEDVCHAAQRELFEETQLRVKSLRQLHIASEPNRDPRTRIITVPFLAEVENPDAVCASDDAMAAKWCPYSYKKQEMSGVTFFEISIVADDVRHSFKVSKSFDKTGLSSDPIYKAIGKNPLAGDHAELFAMAIDYKENSK